MHSVCGSGNRMWLNWITWLWSLPGCSQGVSQGWSHLWAQQRSRSASKPIQWLLVGCSSLWDLTLKPQLLTGCWPEAALWPSTSRHLRRVAHNVAAQLVSVSHPRKAWERRWASRKSVIYNLASQGHPITFAIICSWKARHKVQPNSRERTPQGRVYQQMGITENYFGSLLPQISWKRQL